MKRALVKFCSQPGERERFIQVLLDIAAHRLHHFRRAVAADRSGTAAQAGTVARFFGLVRLAEKGDVFPAGTPGGAGWPAVHAGRGNGKNEAPS